jgi:hypothetical protein
LELAYPPAAREPDLSLPLPDLPAGEPPDLAEPLPPVGAPANAPADALSDFWGRGQGSL